MNKNATFKTILTYIGGYPIQIVLSLLLAVVSVVFTLYVPTIIGSAIDRMVDAESVNLDEVLRSIAAILASVGIAAISQWIMSLINNNITYKVVRDVRRDAFEKIETLPLRYLDAHPSGETLSKVISDADQFADGMLLGFSQLFTGVITIIGTLIFMIIIKPSVALAVVILTPMSLLTARFISSRTHSMFIEQSKRRAEQTAFIEEMIGEQKIVQSFCYEKSSLSEFDQMNEQLRDCSQKAVFFSSLTNPCTRFINSVIYAVVGLTGALSALGGGITVGGLTCLLGYATQYTKPFNEITGVITEFQNALACAGRLFELIDEESEISDPADAAELEDVTGNVALENVRFSYTADKQLIDGLNLRAEKGQRIAIVGPTGCGKTTLINLLMRFYDVNGGAITVDGKDIRDVTRHSLRKSYGMVLQDTWLAAGTIKDNIRFGNPEATDKEVVEVAKKSGAHSFIKRLTNGYDTLIGEDGGGLSQGQCQLLSITRVMLCLPPMLILDEATSSIDTRTELKIQRAFDRMMEGRTSFIVAHRLSTIREADKILVMKDGNVIEQGRHEELLKKNGFYAKLYNSQFEN